MYDNWFSQCRDFVLKWVNTLIPRIKICAHESADETLKKATKIINILKYLERNKRIRMKRLFYKI